MMLIGDRSVMIGSMNALSDATVRGVMRKVVGGWECTQCFFQGNHINKVYQHVEATHVHVTFVCHICKDIFIKRSLLLKHRSVYHRDDIRK